MFTRDRRTDGSEETSEDVRFPYARAYVRADAPVRATCGRAYACELHQEVLERFLDPIVEVGRHGRSRTLRTPSVGDPKGPTPRPVDATNAPATPHFPQSQLLSFENETPPSTGSAARRIAFDWLRLRLLGSVERVDLSASALVMVPIHPRTHARGTPRSFHSFCFDLFVSHRLVSTSTSSLHCVSAGSLRTSTSAPPSHRRRTTWFPRLRVHAPVLPLLG